MQLDPARSTRLPRVSRSSPSGRRRIPPRERGPLQGAHRQGWGRLTDGRKGQHPADTPAPSWRPGARCLSPFWGLSSPAPRPLHVSPEGKFKAPELRGAPGLRGRHTAWRDGAPAACERKMGGTPPPGCRRPAPGTGPPAAGTRQHPPHFGVAATLLRRSRSPCAEVVLGWRGRGGSSDG